MGPYQRTPKEVARAIRYSGLGVRSVGPVGDFLDIFTPLKPLPSPAISYPFWLGTDVRSGATPLLRSSPWWPPSIQSRFAVFVVVFCWEAFKK